ncbi:MULTISPECIES: hypothetical protein [unclassified Mesorhizobium]|nr:MULTISPECIES: hypothetical protein [Mesorhizobium]
MNAHHRAFRLPLPDAVEAELSISNRKVRLPRLLRECALCA